MFVPRHWPPVPGGSLTARNLRSSKSQDVRAPSAPRAASPSRSPAAPARPRQTSPPPRQTSPPPRPATVAAPPGRPATTPTTSTANRERSLGASRSTVSTGSLAVRPQTARAAVAPTTQRAQSARRNQTPSTARTARPQSVRRSESDTLTRSQSRVSPRRTGVLREDDSEGGAWVCTIVEKPEFGLVGFDICTARE